MPRPTEHERKEFVAEPHVGVLVVASDSERPPLAVPLFYAYEPGGDVTFFTATGHRTPRKVRLIHKAGVVSLVVQREDPPRRYVTVEGTVVRADRPPRAEQMLTIARRYMSEAAAQQFVSSELANPGPELVVFTIRPDRFLTGPS